MPCLAFSNRNAPLSLWFVMASLMSAGCQTPQPRPILPPLSRDEVVAQYNHNVISVPSFQARISHWEIHFTDHGKESTHKDSSGKFFFQTASPDQPEQFYLQADTTLASRALVLACDADKVWMISKPASRGAWAKRTNKNSPCMNNQPLHPDSFLELIGLKPLPNDPHQFPLPLYRIRAEEFSLCYLQHHASESFIEREIIFDRHTNLPTSIFVYDSTGKLLISAQLNNYQSLGPAMIPGDIALTYPQNGSYLKLKLRQFKPNGRDLSRLLASSYQQLKKLKNIQQLDYDCNHDSNNTPSEKL